VDESDSAKVRYRGDIGIVSGGVMAEQSDQSTDQPNQSEQSYRSEQPRPIADLLVDALEYLPADDRKRVTAWVLARTTRQYGWLSREGAQARRDWHVAASTQQPPLQRVLVERAFENPAVTQSLAAQLLAGTPLKGEHQVVPVRLPAQQHAELRDWCAEHGFSMATVIRGLLTRFLEGQSQATDLRSTEPEPDDGDVEEA
jgi:hypothetical protein